MVEINVAIVVRDTDGEGMGLASAAVSEGVVQEPNMGPTEGMAMITAVLDRLHSDVRTRAGDQLRDLERAALGQQGK